MRYRIFQIISDNHEATQRRFMSYSSLPDGIPDPKHYSQVYQGELESTASPGVMLESLFCTFNTDHPKDFTGHSMSVSDVVELIGEDGQHADYYVDSFGFKLVPFEYEASDGIDVQAAFCYTTNKEGRDAAMKKVKIYLDTSVISYLLAEDTPDKMADTHKLWQQIVCGQYEVFMSSLTLDELNACPDPKRQKLIDYVNQIHFTLVEASTDTLELAEKFIDFGILKQKSIDDCQHIAAALLSNCDVIISWNFKHIVCAKTMKGTRVIATSEGYKDILICSPTMMIGDDENE